MREKKRHPASMGILFLFVVFTVSAVAMPDATATTTSFSLLSESELYTMFKSWLVKHGKSYSLPVEEDVRFKIFKDNVRYIEEHNAGDHSYKLGVNKLADLSIEEYRSTYTGIKKVDSKQKGKLENVVSDRYSVNPGEILPLSVDWRSKGAVTSVKDQGRCGRSCWPFSTIGSVEGINQIVTGDLVTISEQQLLDRDIFYNQGCNGGDIEHAFAFVVNYGGIHTDKDYPCTGKDGKCDTSENETKVVRIDNYEGVPANNEQSLQKAVANQPISVSIEAGSRDFQFYSSGIFNGKCGTDLDHGVVVVGYGAEAGKNYWLLKNSWGGDWGEQGYLRIERNVKETTGKCGIAMKASYPIKNDRSPPNPTAGPSHSTPVTPQPQQFLKEDTQPHLEPNVSGNLIGILSMDGSGVLGIIPSVILAFVEQTLVVISEAIMEIASGYPIASIAVLFPFVLFMVASVATYCTKHMTKTPKLITILSIDGGGVRAIIPCIFLEFLEKKLQELAGENVRLADYFDVMAGTSAGAFVVVMLAAPNKDGRPMLEATDATKFFLRHAPEIFQPPSKNPLTLVVKMIKDFFRPKHNRGNLERVLGDTLQETRLSEACTKIIIAAYDMEKSMPIIFSSFKVEKNPMLDAKFSDICIGTSAAPTYLPTHELTIDDAEGKILRKVNLVDGGLFANNPTELAIGEVTRSESTSDYRLLVLSLGTGTQDFEVKYKGARSSHWGIKGWLGGFRSSPILDAYSSSSGYMDEYRGSTLMKLHRSEEMYLRIQDYTLSGDTASMDLATEENLHNLVKVAKDRLKKPVTRRNPDTGELEADPHITNEMALEMFAKLLHEEHKSRKN